MSSDPELLYSIALFPADTLQFPLVEAKDSGFPVGAVGFAA